MKPKTTELMKFRRLCKRLDDSKRGVVGLLELLWNATASNCPEGDVGRFPNDEIAFMCGWEGDPDQLVTALVETRWLDASPTYRLIVHNWDKHAPTYVHGNLKRWKKEFAKDIRDTPVSNIPPASQDVTSLPSLTFPNLSPPPPPAEPADPEWEEAEAALISAGVGSAPSVIEAVRTLGAQPIEVRRVISHWRSKQPAWGVGGLVHRLSTLRHNQDPADPNLWPPPSAAAKATENGEQRVAVAVKAAEQRRAGEQRTIEAENERRRLEAEHGGEVNALAFQDMLDVLATIHPKGFGKIYGRIPDRGIDAEGRLRDALLSYFDSPTAASPTP